MNTALITGASRGIGAAAAEEFAGQGYSLVLNCRNSGDRLEALAAGLRTEYHVDCMTCVGDVGSDAFVHDMFAAAGKRFGGIDILVNNAGISHVGLLHEMSTGDWRRMIDTNLSSVFFCCKEGIPYMLSQKRGKIINISSVWGCVGASCETAYSAAKGGVNALTMALAKELAPSNIQVNAIACGAIDTEMNACFSSEEKAALESEIPCGRFGTPKEVAELIYSLANTSSYLTGQIIRLDGGWI